MSEIQLTDVQLRQMQLIQLEMLCEVNRICRKHGIKYSLDGGTLLGAVRHKGFIPWDDDIDLIMTRSEYQRFYRVAKEEMDAEKFFLQEYRTDPYYYVGYPRIRRNHTVYMRAGHEHMKYHGGVFIDIFILDNVPDHKVMRMFHRMYCFILRKVLWSESGKYLHPNGFVRFLLSIISKIPREKTFHRIEALADHYNKKPTKLVRHLLELIKDKDYFVLTTNVDHQFQMAGFDKKRLFYTQGDYGLWQCSKACHNRTYDNEEAVRQMVTEQKDLKIPTELIPKCPVCGEPMTMNLRCDYSFVQDEGWYQAANRYEDFIRQHKGMRMLFLELGVGANTPGIIKYPFWKMTKENPKAVYVCVNQGEAVCPEEIKEHSVCIYGDIGWVLQQIAS